MKKNIETVQGSDVYPAAQQMLIHQGKVLKDGTTLEENKVAESNFIVIMLTKVNMNHFFFLLIFSVIGIVNCMNIDIMLDLYTMYWGSLGG